MLLPLVDIFSIYKYINHMTCTKYDVIIIYLAIKAKLKNDLSINNILTHVL